MMRGAATVEFALLVIPLLLLGFGGAEYGRALYQYNALVKSVRDSARYLSQYAPTVPATYPTSQAKCLAVFGNTACTGAALAPGLTTSMVYICDSLTQETGCQASSQYSNVSTGSGFINLVEVGIIGYPFSFVFNPAILLGGAAPAFITFGGTTGIHATMRQS